ncbi:MAG: sulfurtransferase TusA family protein [Desulfobacterales bacterium]
MSDIIKTDTTLDLKGLACPLPVVKVAVGIKQIEIGGVLEAIVTDPGSLSDMPAWARINGHEILKTEEDGSEIRFYIKRIV